MDAYLRAYSLFIPWRAVFFGDRRSQKLLESLEKMADETKSLLNQAYGT
jgi:hypothetical protein